MSSIIQKFKTGDKVCLISDTSKRYIVEKYHFQQPIIRSYKLDTSNNKFDKIHNVGSDTAFVWCISVDTKRKRKIHQDKLQLDTTS
jgi:hypothetical protein